MVRVAGAPWWLAIAVGYVVATSTHFVLHRTVVFRARRASSSRWRSSCRGSSRVVVCQYAVTTLAMTLPAGPAESVVFFGVAACVTVASFVLLRTRLFH